MEVFPFGLVSLPPIRKVTSTISGLFALTMGLLREFTRSLAISLLIPYRISPALNVPGTLRLHDSLSLSN